MTNEHQELLQAWDVLGETTDILLDSLLSKDMDKSHEAVSVLQMQAMNIFGQEHPVFQQCFPVWDAIKSHIDENNSSDPALLIASLEKFVCIPDPFQSPVLGFG